MTDSRKYEPPKPDRRDTAYALTRAGLSSVPYIGGAAVEVLPLLLASPLERRREKWMEEVGQALRDLEENQGIILEELQSNDVPGRAQEIFFPHPVPPSLYVPGN